MKDYETLEKLQDLINSHPEKRNELENLMRHVGLIASIEVKEELVRIGLWKEFSNLQ